MKKYVLPGLALIMATASFAQRNCGTSAHEDYLNQQDRKRAEQRARYEAQLQQWAANNPTANKSQQVVTIPVVVHVVYNTSTQNIQDAQVQSQIDVLNADFTRTNADAVNTPTAFQTAASSPQIQFCLASVDPSGNPTNGIDRKSTTVTSFTTDDKVKFTAQGGADAWDVTKYFNIWVCPLSGGLLGYAEFPTGTASNTFGVVSGYNYFGDTLTVSAPFNKGRTATHEVGHCFNLRHIWGDDGSGCTGSDQCTDTPNQAGASYGCPGFPKTDACSPSSPGVMYMNYMDYSDDACMNMFTADQSTRMLAIVNNAPYNSLTTSTVCASSPLQQDDAGVPSILSPSGTLCGASSVAPSVVIKNFGSATLSSAIINYQINGGAVQTYTYTGSLASLASATVSLPSVAVTTGTHTLSVYTTQPNGNTDGNSANDAATPVVFTVISTGAALPLVEGFEGTTFPPAGWTRNNADGATTWARTTSAFKTGSASMWMDNWNYNASGQVDEMTAPAVNLSQGSSPVLTYQVAYRLYSDPNVTPNYSDTLNILISTNCGQTWTSLGKKFGSSFTTVSPVFSTALFTPTSTQWRMESVSLSGYSTATAAFLKFKHTTDYENSMYIDDINISYSSGISANAALAGFHVYPNPSSNGKFFVDIKPNTVQKLAVYDVLGTQVFSLNERIPSGVYELTLDHLANGTYLIEIMNDNKPVYTRVVINK